MNLKKMLAITFGVALVIFVGLVIYGNFIAKPPATAASPRLPDVKNAPESFLVKNTGTLILGNKFEQFGTVPGSRVYILRGGYWEQVGYEFRFRKSDITLSEKVFGEIIHKRRQ